MLNTYIEEEKKFTCVQRLCVFHLLLYFQRENKNNKNGKRYISFYFTPDTETAIKPFFHRKRIVVYLIF